MLSVVVLVHHAGGKIAMNLKFLLQPTIEKIRQEERAKNTRAMESWLEEQIRAGKINEDVELPEFGGNGKEKHLSGDNGKEGA